MTLISNNSPLKMLPLEMEKEQLHVFDSIRFLLEAIEYSFEALNKHLLDVSIGNAKHAPSIFTYAWSIVDNTHRLKKICGQLPYEDKYQLIKNIEIISNFRNSSQHIDERIKKIVEGNDKPIFGLLTWEFYEALGNEFAKFAFIPGNHKACQIEFPATDSSKLKVGINNITLQAFQRTTSEILHFDTLIKDLKQVASDLEKGIVDFCIDKNLQLCNWEKRQDITLQIPFKIN